MFNFLRGKPKPLTRMSHPIWRFYFEELHKAGKHTDDDSIKKLILASFAFQHEKKAEAMCREGYSRFGRGAIIHVPTAVSGKEYANQQFHSGQYYQIRANVADLIPQLGRPIIEALAQDMVSYNPDTEYISAVMMTFNNEGPTPLDFMGWLIIPY